MNCAQGTFIKKVNGVNFDFKLSLKECMWHNEYDNMVVRVAKE